MAADLGINVNTLTAWRKAYAQDAQGAFPDHGKQTPQQAELTALPRENARLKRQVEILEKAKDFFANESVPQEGGYASKECVCGGASQVLILPPLPF